MSYAPGTFGRSRYPGITFRSGDMVEHECLLAGYKTTVLVGPAVAGGASFDPGNHSIAGLSRTIKFKAVLSTTDVTKTARVWLYSLSDSATIGYLSSTSLSPELLTLTLSVGAIGPPSQIPDAERQYELRLYLVGSDGIEQAILHKASIDVLHTAP